MTDPLAHREEQARREVGRTAVTRPLAVLLTVVFLATIASGVAVQVLWPSAEGAGAAGLVDAVRVFLAQSKAAFRVAAGEGFFAGNRTMHRAIDNLETRLEDDSRLREAVRPSVQLVLSQRLGVGDEQVYLGRDGWLFFRPGVDSVTGPAFLDRRVIERRALGGDEWAPPPHPDPLPVVRGWAEALAARGIDLLLVPTPVKASMRPEALAGRGAMGSIPRNPSYDEFLDAAREAGAHIYDPAPVIATSLSEGGTGYLQADTHWRPEVVERVADGLARKVERLVSLDGTLQSFRGQVARVSNRGDLFDLLGLPDRQTLVAVEEVEIRRIVDSRRRLWRPNPDAEILLLGDSFSNVYSMPELGWGEGAGLAEQLASSLRRPIDKIAVNAGGAFGARERLIADLAAGRDRLRGKKIVVWQFAERELAVGDWKPLPLPATEEE